MTAVSQFSGQHPRLLLIGHRFWTSAVLPLLLLTRARSLQYLSPQVTLTGQFRPSVSTGATGHLSTDSRPQPHQTLIHTIEQGPSPSQYRQLTAAAPLATSPAYHSPSPLHPLQRFRQQQFSDLLQSHSTV